MWAFEQTGPSRLVQVEVPGPAPSSLRDGEVLIRTVCGGICGSDLPYYLGRRSRGDATGTPGFPLHEIAGEVIASRSGAITVGSMVVGWAGADDGLAEFVVAPASSVHAFSSTLDAAQAIMLQPLACVLYAAERIGLRRSDSVAILGVGPIGVLFTHVFKSLGAARVTGVDRVDRSDVQRTFGMDEFVHSDVNSWADGLSESERPSVVVEAIGHQVDSFRAAITAASQEGRVFYFGVPNDPVYPLSMEDLLRKHMTLQSGVTPMAHRRRCLAQAEMYLAEYPELADEYLTSRYLFAQAQSAFEAAIRPRTGQLKVTLNLE